MFKNGPDHTQWKGGVNNYKVAANGCWIWQGCVMPNGYGQLGYKGHHYLAHRAMWEETYGPIPKDMTIDHECHKRSCLKVRAECLHRRCINPSHLAVVPMKVNIARSLNSSARKLRCPKGHPYSGDNLFIRNPNDAHKGRECRSCRKTRRHDYYLAHRKPSPSTPKRANYPSGRSLEA